jgi:hypothetical protein
MREGVLLGVLGNTVAQTWFFCGEFVVECVVNVVSGHAFLRRLKMRHLNQKISG